MEQCIEVALEIVISTLRVSYGNACKIHKKFMNTDLVAINNAQRWKGGMAVTKLSFKSS